MYVNSTYFNFSIFLKLFYTIPTNALRAKDLKTFSASGIHRIYIYILISYYVQGLQYMPPRVCKTLRAWAIICVYMRSGRKIAQTGVPGNLPPPKKIFLPPPSEIWPPRKHSLLYRYKLGNREDEKHECKHKYITDRLWLCFWLWNRISYQTS